MFYKKKLLSNVIIPTGSKFDQVYRASLLQKNVVIPYQKKLQHIIECPDEPVGISTFPSIKCASATLAFIQARRLNQHIQHENLFIENKQTFLAKISASYVLDALSFILQAIPLYLFAALLKDSDLSDDDIKIFKLNKKGQSFDTELGEAKCAEIKDTDSSLSLLQTIGKEITSGPIEANYVMGTFLQTVFSIALLFLCGYALLKGKSPSRKMQQKSGQLFLPDFIDIKKLKQFLTNTVILGNQEKVIVTDNKLPFIIYTDSSQVPFVRAPKTIENLLKPLLLERGLKNDLLKINSCYQVTDTFKSQFYTYCEATMSRVLHENQVALLLELITTSSSLSGQTPNLEQPASWVRISSSFERFLVNLGNALEKAEERFYAVNFEELAKNTLKETKDLKNEFEFPAIRHSQREYNRNKTAESSSEIEKSIKERAVYGSREYPVTISVIQEISEENVALWAELLSEETHQSWDLSQTKLLMEAFSFSHFSELVPEQMFDPMQGYCFIPGQFIRTAKVVSWIFQHPKLKQSLTFNKALLVSLLCVGVFEDSVDGITPSIAMKELCHKLTADPNQTFFVSNMNPSRDNGSAFFPFGYARGEAVIQHTWNKLTTNDRSGTFLLEWFEKLNEKIIGRENEFYKLLIYIELFRYQLTLPNADPVFSTLFIGMENTSDNDNKTGGYGIAKTLATELLMKLFDELQLPRPGLAYTNRHDETTLVEINDNKQFEAMNNAYLWQYSLCKLLTNIGEYIGLTVLTFAAIIAITDYTAFVVGLDNDELLAAEFGQLKNNATACQADAIVYSFQEQLFDNRPFQSFSLPFAFFSGLGVASIALFGLAQALLIKFDLDTYRSRPALALPANRPYSQPLQLNFESTAEDIRNGLKETSTIFCENAHELKPEVVRPITGVLCEGKSPLELDSHVHFRTQGLLMGFTSNSVNMVDKDLLDSVGLVYAFNPFIKNTNDNKSKVKSFIRSLAAPKQWTENALNTYLNFLTVVEKDGANSSILFERFLLSSFITDNCGDEHEKTVDEDDVNHALRDYLRSCEIAEKNKDYTPIGMEAFRLLKSKKSNLTIS